MHSPTRFRIRLDNSSVALVFLVATKKTPERRNQILYKNLAKLPAVTLVAVSFELSSAQNRIEANEVAVGITMRKPNSRYSDRFEDPGAS